MWGKSIPLSTRVKFSDFVPDEKDAEFPFRKLVGSLTWLALQTRPDILNAVRKVARYCASPKKVHWMAAVDILGYEKRTSHFGISSQRRTVSGLVCGIPCDFASKAADRRSVSGGSNHVRRRSCVLISQNAEICHAFNHRGRVCRAQ